MSIPPCTTGTHSTTDLPPPVEEKPKEDDASLAKKIAALTASAPTRVPIQPAQSAPTPPPPPPETEDDDASLEIPDGSTCRRRTCGQKYKKGSSRDDETCVHHPGVPIFHEGSKGYSCCKRRVLEFDQFMKIEGCKTKDRHLFIGSGKKDEKEKASSSGEEILATVRYVCRLALKVFPFGGKDISLLKYVCSLILFTDMTFTKRPQTSLQLSS